MNRLQYTKKPGDLEIRILTDGRVVLVGPDEDMLEIAKALAPAKDVQDNPTGAKEDGRIKAKDGVGED
jgi:hypothetical protein